MMKKMMRLTIGAALGAFAMVALPRAAQANTGSCFQAEYTIVCCTFAADGVMLHCLAMDLPRAQ